MIVKTINKRWGLLVIGAMMALLGYAQRSGQVVVVHLMDGTSHEYAVEDIAYIDFMLQDPYPSVDLGLSVEWATYNVGACAPEEFGDLYAWGELTTKDDYSEDDYLYYKNYEYENIGLDISGTDYDVAHAAWGGQWRMPTKAEVAELTNQCTWKQTKINDVNGFLVTGPNGNSIFLPAAGYQPGTSRKKAGSQGYYWSSTLNEDMPSAAYNINFSGYNGEWSASRAYGFSIRAVR